jgi:hypothetical protein
MLAQGEREGFVGGCPSTCLGPAPQALPGKHASLACSGLDVTTECCGGLGTCTMSVLLLLPLLLLLRNIEASFFLP